MTTSIRVLLADDHTMVRRGLAALLTEDGEVEVVAEAENGKEAVEKALETNPDVVIMDISMPEMTGRASNSLSWRMTAHDAFNNAIEL